MRVSRGHVSKALAQRFQNIYDKSLHAPYLYYLYVICRSCIHPKSSPNPNYSNRSLLDEGENYQNEKLRQTNAELMYLSLTTFLPLLPPLHDKS